MKFLSYALFAIPAITLLILLFTPDPFALQHGPWLPVQLKLLETIAIMSPLLTVVGVVIICRALINRDAVIESILTTALALVPGILVLVLVHPTR